MSMTDERRLEIAYHEAGHVVACLVFGHAFDSVHVEDDRSSVKYSKWCERGPTNEYDDKRLRERMVVYYAGLAAQRLYNPEAQQSEAGEDYLYADRVYSHIEYPPSAFWFVREARDFADKYSEAIEVLAAELAKQRTLQFDQARELVEPLIGKVI